jgi:hypothetical protein
MRIFRIPAWRVSRFRYHAPLALLAVAVLGTGANPPTEGIYPVPPSQPSAAGQPASPMDAPLRVIAQASQAYRGVRDYTCLFVKREVVRGQMQPENLISMKVRTQPFSVYLRWIGPKQMEGQEACYVAGRNSGMMRVHSTGLLGAVGFVSMDPRDPRALQTSRHSITEAGIGHLIEKYAQRWQVERQLGKTQVRIADYEYNKRACTRIECLHPDNSGGQFYAYRSVLYFDKQTRLPIRVENYSWPRAGGNPAGDLFEAYSYVDMKFNVGLGDDSFNY